MYSCISSSFRLSTECFVKKLYRQRPMQPALRLLSLICDGPVLQLRARYVLYFNHNRTFIVCSSSVHPAILFQNVELGSAPPWSARGVVQPEHAGYGYHQWKPFLPGVSSHHEINWRNVENGGLAYYSHEFGHGSIVLAEALGGEAGQGSTQ